MTDLRLALPAVTAWIAAGILIGMPAAALPVAIGLWLVAAAVLLLRLPGVLALCCVAGALLGSLVAAHADQRESLEQQRFIEVSLVVTGVGEGTVESVPIRVFGDLDAPIGATVLLAGTAVPTDAGDRTAYLFFASRSEVTADPPWFLAWANGLRSSFAAASAVLPGDGAALLPGLAIGDTSAVSEKLDAEMKAASLSHLTAVSGSNCAIVVGLIVLLGRTIGLSRTARTVAALVVLAAFVILVTPEPSVMRAAVMAAIVLLALASGRPVRGLPVLALAVIVLLAGDPWLARDYGFALSVLATGGLLLLAAPIARLLERWMPLPLATVIAVPLAAQVCCQPVLILLQPSLPTYGVLANVLAEPAAPAATVIGLLACVTLPLVPWLGQALVTLSWLPASWIAAVATFFAGLPLVALPWPAGLLGLGALAMITVLGIMALRYRWALVAGAAILLVVIGATAGTRIGTVLDRPGEWQFAMCDVGQGDATLIRSAGQVALVDTGPLPGPLTECLSDLGIGHIDLLVLTHFDLDHVGGVKAAVGMVDEVLVGPTDGPADVAVVAELAEGGAVVSAASMGLMGVLGQLRWEVVWPRSGGEPGNDASVSLLVTPGAECPCLSGLFLGDLGEQAQARLLAASDLPTVDVVKVAHHGSADQSARLYERVRASVGLIGVGADNDYGHPTGSLLETLASTGTAAFRTDLDGLILVSASETGATVWTEKAPG